MQYLERENMAQSGDFLETIKVGLKKYQFYSISKAQAHYDSDFSRIPFSHKVLLENLLRHLDGKQITDEDILVFTNHKSDHEISYRPARVLMQDFTGVPAVVDLATMRQAVKDLKGNPKVINPLSPVDLVIDHSVMVDHAGSSDAFAKNVAHEVERNKERYQFLKWGQKAFDNFRVVPPGTGICHQVNLEHLAPVVFENDDKVLYPDTVVGTDSHTTMINGLGVLGWGVGGIEAEAAMLGQPISMLLPHVVGFELTGAIKEGTTATDIVLTVTQMLREKGVVGKFVEFFGDGLNALSLADRATIANMAPEYGATCGFFPVDQETIDYLTLTGRDKQQVKIVEAYAKAQGLWRDAGSPAPEFTNTISLDLNDVEPSLAGPKRPQDRISLAQIKDDYQKTFSDNNEGHSVSGSDYSINHGDIVIAAITSCTNTSNPSVMLAAGLVAKKAVEKGLSVKPWVKTSLAPGSQVVSAYLEKAGLQDSLDQLGFQLVGYGCTTCIGNSGPLDPAIDSAIRQNDVTVCSVLSGNRNFEGRIHPLTSANYLASPPLVVAYALAGNVQINLTNDPLGEGSDGKPVYLKDIWPTQQEIDSAIKKSVTQKMFKEKYADVFKGDEQWQKLAVTNSQTYQWDDTSTYIKHPPYFEGMQSEPEDRPAVENARILALLGDSVTTDHISPAGAIAKDSPAAKYLESHGVTPEQFNSYGSRRGNHEVMMRGTFANIRIQNEMTPEKTGGFTRHYANSCQERCYCPITLSFRAIKKIFSCLLGCKSCSTDITTIYDAAEKYKASNTPLVVIAGNDYGMGSSRDWAAKGTLLLGVKAVIAESFERIHRSNLVGMGVLPFTFKQGIDRKSLGLKGDELITIQGLDDEITPAMEVKCLIRYSSGKTETIPLTCRLDTQDEIDYFKQGGILQKVIRSLL
jgi:aconitate hydratase